MKNDNNYFGIGKRIIQQEEAKNKPINPFIQLKEGEVPKALVNIEQEINGSTRFAILKTTENGKYVKGGMLTFKLGDVSIITEIDNIIFVDTINMTLFVKKNEIVADAVAPTNPEERQYIIMMTCNDSSGEYYSWEAMTGRQTAYEYIVDNIDECGIDPEKSFVLTENVPYKDALTVSGFVKYLKNSELIPEDGFDIDNYIY